MRIQVAIILWKVIKQRSRHILRAVQIWSVSNKVFADPPNTSSELMYAYSWPVTNFGYFSCFQSELVFRFVGRSTVNSRLYKILFGRRIYFTRMLDHGACQIKYSSFCQITWKAYKYINKFDFSYRMYPLDQQLAGLFFKLF